MAAPSDQPGYIVVPAGENMHTVAASTIMRAVVAAPRGSATAIDPFPTWGPRGIAEKRERIAEAFLKAEGFAWLLMLDGDMVPPADLVPRLLSHGPEVGVVAGYYYTRRPPYNPACGFHGDGIRYLERDEPRGLMAVDWSGAGALLVWRHVLEAVPRPWFASPAGMHGGGEDSYFSKAAHAAGFSLHVDTSLLLGHVGTAVIDDEFVQGYRAGPRFARDLWECGMTWSEGRMQRACGFTGFPPAEIPG